jgi:hypothetical protein
MLSIYLFTGLFILGLVIAILVCRFGGYDSDFWAALSGGVSFISFIVALFLWVDIVNIDKEFDAFVNRYNFTKELVINYEPNDYGNKTALLDEVVSINKEIAKHKAYVGNIWSGVNYSEKIAALEPIVFTGKTPTISIEKAE